jgi:hypothetical protein
LHENSSRRVIDRGSIEICKKISSNKHGLMKVKVLRRFKPTKRKVEIELSSPEEYIAYRIKSFITLICKFGKKKENIEFDEEDFLEIEGIDLEIIFENQDYDELSYSELEECVYELDIKRFKNKTFVVAEKIFLHDVRQIREYNDLVGRKHFQDLWDNLECVKEIMGFDYEAFIKLLEHYTKQSKDKTKDDEKYKKEKQEKLQNINHQQGDIYIKNNEIVIKALEYALARVDTSRSDKEIVKYVNKLWTTQYIKSRERNYKDID